VSALQAESEAPISIRSEKTMMVVLLRGEKIVRRDAFRQNRCSEDRYLQGK